MWKRSFISSVRPTVHNNPSRKRSFTKTLFKPEEFENPTFRFRVDRSHFYENEGVTMVMWFPWTSFPQAQLQNDRWLLRFLNSSRVDGKHDVFSEWKLGFQIPAVQWWRGLSITHLEFCTFAVDCISYIDSVDPIIKCLEKLKTPGCAWCCL